MRSVCGSGIKVEEMLDRSKGGRIWKPEYAYS